MSLSIIDWLIIASMLALMIWGVMFTKKLMRSVSDFLAAGRSAGRYVLSFASGMAQLGAISIIGLLEMNYIAGFSLRWWEYANGIVILIVTLSGWVVYRFRQTRALTLAQFFEMRYSKNFRIFAGILSFSAGVINFGIFPAVGSRFFIYFCGFPDTFNLFGLEISTFVTIMTLLLGISLFFVFVGGQISVIITDFIQGLFVNIIFVITVVYVLSLVDWDIIYQTLHAAPQDASLINPFNTSKVEDFNFWYFFVGMVGIFYGKLSWQGHQGYYTSASSPHEAKMGEVLSNWRTIPQWSLFIYVIPVVAYVLMNDVSFSQISTAVHQTLGTVDGGEAIKSQLTVPLVLQQILPVGLFGAFAAIMLAAFVTTHDTYLHSWASIFIQDVYIPLTGKKLAPEKHLRLLKIGIFGVAVFIFLFSLFFQQSEYIFLFFAITGAIFLGGSGAVIIGGLYWKRGTTAAAWSALITGSVIALTGIVIHQLVDDFFINGQSFWGLAMAGSTIVYIAVSLLGKKQEYDLDKLLHRGKYAVKEDEKIIEQEVKTGWRALGIGKEFTKGDKLIYIATYIYTFAWTAVFIIGTIYNLTTDVPDMEWMQFWKIFIYINIAVSVVVIFWFGIGGIFDLKTMFRKLRSTERDFQDDGHVN
ncbi:MAG: sodium:solute symporter [Rhodothermaceae bacterium]